MEWGHSDAFSVSTGTLPSEHKEGKAEKILTLNPAEKTLNPEDFMWEKSEQGATPPFLAMESIQAWDDWIFMS